MKRCMRCGLYKVKNPNHDLCFDCFKEKELEEKLSKPEEKFEDNLFFNEIYTVYIMIFGKNQYKIGYTKDLNSRLFELKRQYPNNQLVYFREFVNESEARRFEVWLKTLSEREINKFIIGFQDKVKKVQIF